MTRTAAFDLPLRRKRNGDFRVPSGEMVYTCFTSDFFLKKPMNGEPKHGL